MAERPVFLPLGRYPWYKTENISFRYAAGFALVQRQKNIQAIHEGFEKIHPGVPVLEASSKAPTELGKALSPFYLELEGIPVENRFQAAKVFTKGGPYEQLLSLPAMKAKTDRLTKDSGPLLYYEWKGEKLPVVPQGWFFLYLYCLALDQHPQLMEQVKAYGAFTDIAFNPGTGHACQAMALAMYLALEKKGLFSEAVSSWEAFRKMVFKCQ